MTQNEFEVRICRSVSEEEYVEANAMYELAGDGVDKDVFCREWKKIGESPLVKGLYETAYQRGQQLVENKLMLNECREIISDATDAMLDIEAGLLAGDAASTAAWELERKAWWLVGPKEVVLRKIKIGMTLTEKDLNYIRENLK